MARAAPGFPGGEGSVPEQAELDHRRGDGALDDHANATSSATHADDQLDPPTGLAQPIACPP